MKPRLSAMPVAEMPSTSQHGARHIPGAIRLWRSFRLASAHRICQIGLAAITTLIALAISTPAFAAGAGYGSGTPVVGGATGDVANVLFAGSIGARGQTVVLSCNSRELILHIPSAAFRAPSEVIVTRKQAHGFGHFVANDFSVSISFRSFTGEWASPSVPVSLAITGITPQQRRSLTVYESSNSNLGYRVLPSTRYTVHNDHVILSLRSATEVAVDFGS
jgi:hypothetical protein